MSFLTKIKDMNPLSRRNRALIKRELIGLAQDYWKDGDWRRTDDEGFGKIDDHIEEDKTEDAKKDGPKLWQAQPGEISEKMWGRHCVTPGDEFITDLLIRPLGLNKDMSLLDLSAGLGGRLRKTTNEFGIYITGLEPDAAIAERGMELSRLAGRGKRAAIAAYDPATFVSARSYDCVISRETIYRLADQEKFIKAIAACCKPKAQISFTDYIVDPEVHDVPAISAWRAYELGANPPSLVAMAEMWAKGGVILRVHDDQTEYYKKEILHGMQRLATFLAKGVDMTPETKQTINRRVKTWAYRMAAFQAGMKFYRFYGVKS